MDRRCQGLKVGIFGVTRRRPRPARPGERDGVEPRDPVEAARRSTGDIVAARGAQLVIALLHLPTVAATAGGSGYAVPGIDWAVLGHVGRRFESAQHTPREAWLLR